MTMITLVFARRGMMTTIGKKHKEENAALNGLRFLRRVTPRLALCAVCCEQSANAHPKSAIQIRNRALVDRSDFCVFCVTHKSGGAYQTLRYAERVGAKLINLSDLIFD